MYSFSDYKVTESKNGCDVLLYMSQSYEEISEELGRRAEDKETLEKEATRFIKNKLPDLKEGVVKIMGGALLVTSFVLGTEKSVTAETDDATEQDKRLLTVKDEKRAERSMTDSIEGDEGSLLTDASLDIEDILQPYEETDNLLSEINKLPNLEESIVIPERTEKEIEMDEDDLEWLAKMIYCEARGESIEGQIAVGAVIINRIEHEEFPERVKDVILEEHGGHYQFSPAASGEIYSAEPDAKSIEAAKRAIRGEDPTNGSLYFFNPDKTDDQWIRSRTVSKVIGNHVFSF
ncbi:cell wall hydrolase [Halalkalibacter urbisdiaboli]|uniref:cell wall hydrolase n=1 Tax=Halalkalibacter urbisdiaboli TaxID=1960589 RepID=UPI000B42F4AB|nr:cell wall hydrolase [Halalkalibacter urbisdiaboli]